MNSGERGDLKSKYYINYCEQFLKRTDNGVACIAKWGWGETIYVTTGLEMSDGNRRRRESLARHGRIPSLALYRVERICTKKRNGNVDQCW